MRTLTWSCYDCFGDDERTEETCAITEDEYDVILHLTPELLYNYVKDCCIGKVTPSGETKFVPRFEFGKFSLSIQSAYYLWCKRDDELGEQRLSVYMSGGSVNNSPMTEKEWNELFPSIDTYFDVMVEYGECYVPISPTQMSCRQLVRELLNMVED